MPLGNSPVSSRPGGEGQPTSGVGRRAAPGRFGGTLTEPLVRGRGGVGQASRYRTTVRGRETGRPVDGMGDVRKKKKKKKKKKKNKATAGCPRVCGPWVAAGSLGSKAGAPRRRLAMHCSVHLGASPLRLGALSVSVFHGGTFRGRQAASHQPRPVVWQSSWWCDDSSEVRDPGAPGGSSKARPASWRGRALSILVPLIAVQHRRLTRTTRHSP